MTAQSTSGRVALITGASKGLGRVLANFLAAQGYHLIINARNEGQLQQAAGELAQYGVTVRAIAGDINDSTHRQALIDAVGAFGRLDLLINNASTLGPLPMPTLANYPPNALLDVFAINVVAPVALVQSALPLLKTAGGLVINLSSDAAVGGYAGWGGYGASKAALDLVSLTLANELNAEGIGVVSVDPGDMRTDMHQDAFPGEDISDRPLPDATLPFWAWLLGQDVLAVSGQRLKAQADVWEVHS